ncbi:hypothetical protein L211DRAFT_850615 [Terfezia boudieri ATCC MYA-4762]|uniref:Uncharacterized protein n=1 Tax=Terfezia boudieri ATCC MYA-4762 TaxID=1051890 RepID=A0A3N4LM81_9PEZI|nr:hypothetical protein L211DRAFT_850615 [Terfezia boudieri ATCC MYA-4762]
MSESFYTSPTGEVRHMTACTAEEAAETLARANAAESLAVGTIIPDSTGGTRESSPAMSPTSTTDPITTFMGGVQPVIGISEKPSRDSYVEGNSPICNLGASGTPLKYSPHGDTRTEAKPEPFRDTDTHMTNNVADCQPGLTASQHADANPRAGVAEMPGTTALGGGSEVTAPTEKELSVVARVVEAVKTKPIARSRKIQRNIQRTPALVGGFNGRFQESSRYKTPEEEEEDTSAQGSKGRQAGKAHPGTGANVTPIGPSQKPYKQSTPEKPSKRSTPGTTPPTINKATPATGANATPIGPREAAPESTPLAHGKPAEEEDSKSQGSSRHNTPEKDTRVSAFLNQDIAEAEVSAAMEKEEREERTSAPERQHSRTPEGKSGTRQEDGTRQGDGTRLVEGKPGRIQRTPKGNKGYWNKGPENTADISPPPVRPTSVQVLITGCPTIPARGDEWKRSFLAGFNARRERLAPETPICATQVSFAFSYPTERVVTIRHPPNMKQEEIVRAVARVRREMYNNYTQHPNQAMISILQETTELVAPGLQGTRGEKAWDRADAICKSLKLVRAARPPKWLVKGKGDGYEGKKCSLRFSVTTASLRAIKAPLPIVHAKTKIYLYQRVDDKAFYVDEMNYMVSEPRPSHSPDPIQRWVACTYCHTINHTEDKCWSKRNADAWRSHNRYQEAAAARNTRGRPEGRTRRDE